MPCSASSAARRSSSCASFVLMSIHVPPRRSPSAIPPGPETTSLTALGEGRHVITQSDASATARGEAAGARAGGDERGDGGLRRDRARSAGSRPRARAPRGGGRGCRGRRSRRSRRAAAHGGSPASGSRCRCVPLVGMRERDRLVELDAEARRRRRDHVAVLPADRLLQQRGVDPVPAPDPLEDQEVRACTSRAGCWRRRRPARSRGAARSARSGTRPCAAIFLASSRPPTRPVFICRIEAAPVSSTRANSCLVVSRSPVAMGMDVARATRAISSGASGGVGLLEPERIEALEPPRQADRARDGELPVRAEQQVAARAHGLADLPDVALAAVEVVERRLARIERRVRAGRVELDRREAERGVLRRAHRRELGVGVDVGRVARPRGRGSCTRAAARARARRAARRRACRPPCRRCPTSPSRSPRARRAASGRAVRRSPRCRRRARSPRCGTARARRRGGRRRPRSCAATSCGETVAA